MSSTFTPYILTIKVFGSGTVSATPKQISELLSAIGTVVDVTSTPMTFDGDKLVPATPPAVVRAAAAPSAPAAKKAALPAPKVKKSGTEIRFEQGSDAEKVWFLLRDGPALTSTQIRETLGLGSNIVNTTVYRLKGAGMIRPMSYNAPNGDTLYTGTNSDTKPVKRETVDLNAAMAEFADGIDYESPL